MGYRYKEPCGWEQRDASPPLEELQGYLTCAATHGCRRCVECSERAMIILTHHLDRRQDAARDT